MKFVDTTGRVEKFQKKYNWDKRKKAGEPAEAKAAEPSRSQVASAIQRGKRKPIGAPLALRHFLGPRPRKSNGYHVARSSNKA